MKVLDQTLTYVLVAAGLASTAAVQAAEHAPAAAAVTSGIDFDANGRQSDRGPLFEVRTRGKREPATHGTTEASGDEALEPDRRVTIEVEPVSAEATQKVAAPGKAVAVGKWSVQLPDGGLVWAIEDPAVVRPVLNVQAPSVVAFENGRIVESVRFYAYANHVAFIDRMEIAIYAASDTDLVAPLATVPVPRGNGTEVLWSGELAQAAAKLRVGDELLYVLRAFDKEGHVDETQPSTLQLLSPEDRKRGLELQRLEASSRMRDLTADQLESRRLIDQTYGRSTLRQQNIPVRGSRVRLHGERIPAGAELRIDGATIPVDMDGRFAAEYILPIGNHDFKVEVVREGGAVERVLPVEISGRYMFMVALADLTVSKNEVSGSVEPLGPDDKYDDMLVDGRLAFYLKGKIQGKYLITAHADTAEREVKDLFNGFFDAEPTDIFRRLDPDLYYPVYGDDSVVYRDVDTQGRLYLRLDWDKSQAIWGNFQTGIAASQHNQYVRSLYGAALNYNSEATTSLGEAKTHAKVFASKAQTAPGHNEFLGTGGSLYYLRNTDVVPGSDVVKLEIRDRTTGRVVSTVDMIRDVDYEIDEMQGRLILTRPLSQVTQENLPTITRDMPMGGYDNVLLVDYEYVPSGFDSDEVTAGLRAKQWIGDKVAIGATYVDENRNGEDYNLAGVDVTLQAGRGTYVKVERLKSKSTAAPVFYSDNGGLSFLQRNPAVDADREGEATSVEARLNLREQGLTARDATVAAWWRDVDAGYSVAAFDSGLRVREHGVEFTADLNDNVRLSGRYSEAERGNDAIEQTQLLVDWQISETSDLTGEVRRVTERHGGVSGTGTLGAVRYAHRIGSKIEVYGLAQKTLDNDSGAYEDNDSVSVGGKYRFGNLSSVGAELTHGDRGDAAQLSGEYRVRPDHTFYGTYTYSTDRTAYDPLFSRRAPGGLTLGQRWRISNQTSLYNESQWLRSGSGTQEATGLAHTFGMDFYPGAHWTVGFTLQDGKLNSLAGTTDRTAVSVHGGWHSADTTWSSKVEYREDRGSEKRRQWVTTNRVLHKVNESWRVALRLNHSDTEDCLDPLDNARFTEANAGFAWRPWNSNRYALLGKYTYLYDLSSAGQEGMASQFDQRSHVFALEGTYVLNPAWEFAGKLAHREGEVRTGRGMGDWFESRADFAAAQARYRITGNWAALAEHRWLKVQDGGTKRGWLVGLDRDINEHFRIGVGYNFTDFSDNLTKLEYKYQGWFLNIVGSY